MNKNLSEIRYFLKRLLEEKERPFIIVPHEQPDMDAYASSLALRELLRSLEINAYVYLTKLPPELLSFITHGEFPDLQGDIKQIGQIIRQSLPYNVVLIDFSDIKRILSEELKNIIVNAQKVYVIDHHRGFRPHNLNAALILEYPSTSEIITDMIIEANLAHLFDNTLITNALIAGILYDTNFFYHAIPHTFEAMRILSKKGDYKKVWRILRIPEKSLPEKIARIKGAQRAEIIRIDDIVVLVTEIGSYESSVASALISLGADLTIVVSEKKTYYRVSGRSRLDIDLGEIFSTIARQLGGSGGGHKGAAALIVSTEKISKDKLISILLTSIIEKLKKRT